MRVFGEHDWAARLPLALAMLALLLAIYALGLRLYGERGGFYSALAFATAIGPYLYTRFFIPDLLICLWMTLGVHCFLVAQERLAENRPALWPCLGFAATLALNLLTKGLIGLVFPLGFVIIYLAWTRSLGLLAKLHLAASTLLFLAIALPWHVLAAIRNPAIAMPSGLGLPPRAGWTWFYLYNEHFARFLGRRIPHDYGNTPVWLFWLYALIWIMPWGVFLPGAVAALRRVRAAAQHRQAALTVMIWALLVLVFFTLSSRQEYYSLPSMPALALLTGGFLGQPDGRSTRWAIACHRWLLLPITCLVAVVCAFFAIAAPRPAPGTDLSNLLASNPELYNVSLGHLFDLTGPAMGLFRAPLVAVAIGMVTLGVASYILRRRRATYAANLTLAAGMVVVLLAAHEGLVRFNPILGSKGLAEAIVSVQQQQLQPDDLILVDGELTSGSSLLFYTRQPVHLVNGRVNGPWFGSFWPDAPQVFENEASLRELWSGPHQLFLLTYSPASRMHDLESFGKVRVVAASGGKTILSNR